MKTFLILCMMAMASFVEAAPSIGLKKMEGEYIVKGERLNQCSDGVFAKLEKPSNSYILGAAISFFYVDEPEHLEDILGEDGCRESIKTISTKTGISMTTKTVCGKISKDAQTETLTIKSENELIYRSSQGQCLYRKVSSKK